MTTDPRVYERYREQVEDSGAPVTRTLSNRTHRTRTQRVLPCGHEVPAGTRYRKWIGVVDGEFISDVECPRCWETEEEEEL